MNKYLKHHGIKGQKWGVENGPPYPLDPKDRSAAEKRQNPRGGSSGGGYKKRSNENRVEVRRRFLPKDVDKRNVNMLSDRELEDVVRRSDNEKQLFTNKNIIEREANPGRAAVKRILSNMAEKALIGFAESAAKELGKQIIYNTLNSKTGKSNLSSFDDKKKDEKKKDVKTVELVKREPKPSSTTSNSNSRSPSLGATTMYNTRQTVKRVGGETKTSDPYSYIPHNKYDKYTNSRRKAPRHITVKR